MKNLSSALLILFALASLGCTYNQRNDHYYCNDRASQADYEACMDAGEQIEKSEASATHD